MDTNYILDYLQTKVNKATDVEASMLVGLEVVHTTLSPTLSLGQGVITDAANGILTVQFATKSTRLAFPMAFKGVLSPVDPAIKKRLSELGICPAPPPDYSYLKFELTPNKTYCVVGCDEDVESVVIPSKYRSVPVTAIKNGVFTDCKKLKTIDIPDSITEIGAPNIECYGLEAINVDRKNPRYQSVDGILYSKNGTKLIRYPVFRKGSIFRVDGSVHEISREAFYLDINCYEGNLKYLNIAKGVKEIGHCALCNNALKKIYIPETVTYFDDEIFSTEYYDDGPYYTSAIVGGKAGSAIESYCHERNITFIALEDGEIKKFFLTPEDELLEQERRKQEAEVEFVVTNMSAGYQAKFENGILEFSALRPGAYIGKTANHIAQYRREKVKEIRIGDGIASIFGKAFDSAYSNLESVYIGKDVCCIDEDAFEAGPFGYYFDKFSCITVDPENPIYESVDGVLYKRAPRTLIKYPQNKPGFYFEVNCDIGPYAFAGARNVMCVRIGGNCTSVGVDAFLDVHQFLHAWFDKCVTHFESFPFCTFHKHGEPPRTDDLVIGGYKDSYVHEQCKKICAYFIPIEEECEIQKFMARPLSEKEEQESAGLHYDAWREFLLKDPYYAECKKMFIVNSYGHILQVGEHGDELAFPEGTKSINDVNLKGVKRLVIPKTMANMLTCFRTPSPELQEIVVTEGNEHYKITEGHLYSTNGTLLTYLPAAAKQAGVLPEETLSISAYAFNLLEKPLETLYVPASVTNIEVRGCFSQNYQTFYSVEVSPENAIYTSVDGNLFSRDGKTLIYAKTCSGIFTVPDGTEIIGKYSLVALSPKTIIVIPESVKEIRGFLWGYIIRTVKGSYAEQYAGENNINVEFI